MRAERVGATVTATEPSVPEGQTPTPHCLGILWVAPQERFVPIKDGLLLGRDSICEVRLESGGVSRQHARIRREGPLFVLEDLGSKNGTFINGGRSALAPLEDQTVVRLGDWIGVVCHVSEPLDVANGFFHEPTPGWCVGMRTWQRFACLEDYATKGIPILLQGETGVGKEVVASAIHRLGGRTGRFVAVNCAAIPESMAEAELFGHRKGAFTGAQHEHDGLILAAQGGTLFLDEIGDLSASIQAKLLRVVEERSVVPLGSTHAKRVDFALVSATQTPLSSLVADGVFRPDLYARVATAEVDIPPLRTRREEVVALFLHAYRSEQGAAAVSLSSRMVQALCTYDWPYNVRELVRLVRLLSTTDRQSFGVEDLPERFSSLSPGADVTMQASESSWTPTSKRRQMWMFRHAQELARLKEALVGTSGNVSRAAREAGIPRHRALRLLAADPERNPRDDDPA